MAANENYIRSTYYQYLNRNRSIFPNIRAREKIIINNCFFIIIKIINCGKNSKIAFLKHILHLLNKIKNDLYLNHFLKKFPKNFTGLIQGAAQSSKVTKILIFN